MRPPLRISVIVPTYNRSAFVGRTLDSAFAQTRPPDEVIVIDDGSKDNTPEVLAAYPHPLTHRRQENARIGAARNAGQALATGDALAFLDSDDLLLPTALEKLERALRNRPDAALAYCLSQTIDAADTVTEALWDYRTHEGDVWEPLIRGNFIRSTGCALVRRSALESVGSWLTHREMAINEDWEIWLRLAENYPFVRVAEPLFQYRVHGVQLTANEPDNYAWAMRVLNIQRRRNQENPARMAILARVYDSFYEGTEFRWRRAAREDWRAMRLRSALRRTRYLRDLRLSHAAILQEFAPFRAISPMPETAQTPGMPRTPGTKDAL